MALVAAVRHLLLLLAWPSALQLCPSEHQVVGSKPHLNGTFVALSNVTALWPEERWLREFEAMTAVGISFVIVPKAAQGTSDGSSACPSGTYEAFFPVAGPEESQQLLGGAARSDSSSSSSSSSSSGGGGAAASLACFTQTGSTVAGGTLGAISRAARSAGLELHLGLAYPFTHLWMYTDPSRLAHLAATQQLVARHLHRLYGEVVTIGGYYTELEESNQLAFEQHAVDFAQSYLQPIALTVKNLTRLPSPSPSSSTRMTSLTMPTRGSASSSRGKIQGQITEGTELPPLVWASPYGVGNLSRWRGSLGPTNRCTVFALRFCYIIYLTTDRLPRQARDK
jgi:hypothetical protein